MGCVPLVWRQGEGKPRPSEVYVAGSWDNWARQLALEPFPNGEGYGVLLCLMPGEYECKFIVDGQWLTSDEFDVRGKDKNNVIRAGSQLLMPVMPNMPSPGPYPSSPRLTLGCN